MERMSPESSFYREGSDKNNPQLLRNDAVEHASRLHPRGRPGRVAVAVADPERDSGWREEVYSVSELPDVIAALAGIPNVYISQQRFQGWRRIANLKELGALYVDLDFHKRPELVGRHPRGILEDALVRLESYRIPPPTLAIFSGHGLYLLWLHGPVPRAALPRWNACQKYLSLEVLRPLGADPRARDAARVLRVPGTLHKSGEVVEVIGEPGEVWDFDTLADEILPIGRADLHDIRIQRAKRRTRSPSKGQERPTQGFTQATLMEARLSDMQTLKEVRWFGELPEGQRDFWLFVAGVCMSWLAVPQVLQRELFALAREAGGWSEAETRSRMHAVFYRARQHANGMKVDYNGQLVDPLYRFTNDYIIEVLEITPDEERKLRTIISKDEKRRRDRENTKQQRRGAGMVPRAEYEAQALARQREPIIVRLRDEEGMSLREISRVTGIPLSEVSRLSNRIDKGCSESVPLYGGVASPLGLSTEGVGSREGLGESAEAPESPTTEPREDPEPRRRPCKAPRPLLLRSPSRAWVT